MTRAWFFVIVCWGWAAFFVHAQDALEPVLADVEDDQEAMRIDPNLKIEDPPKTSAQAVPEWINRSANVIRTNGDPAWAGLRGLPQHRVANVVHLGDSHVQAEMATTVTRRLLQDRYGAAGRGIILPLKMASTNQPRDYQLSSSSSGWQSARLLHKPWAIPMPWTGVGISPSCGTFTLEIQTRGVAPRIEPFDRVAIMHLGRLDSAVVNATTDEIIPIGIEAEPRMSKDGNVAAFRLERPVTNLQLTLSSPDPASLAIGGMELRDSRAGHGVIYSGIGQNGAAFAHYGAGLGTGQGLETLRPDMVIVALGTNDAFGRCTDDSFYAAIHALVTDIRGHCPGIPVLLVTPQECQRRHTVVVRNKGRKRRGRGRSRRITSYAVNPNVDRLRRVILRYGREQGVATYDWYEVAGSSGRWLANGLMGRDRVHLSVNGYALMGTLMAEALYPVFDARR